MTFAGHLAVTSLALQTIDSPLLLVTANLILHPILDMVPHAEWTSFPHSKVKASLITILDWLLAAAVLLLMFNRLHQPVWLLIVTILAGLWLDIIDPLFGRWLPKLRYIHQWTHSWPERPTAPIDWSKSLTGRTPLLVKLIIQYGLVFLAVKELI